MASPLQTAKQSVNLASNLASAGPRVSRIRRDPPPVVKQKIVDPADREEWTVLVGVVTFALAFVIIIFGFSSTSFRPSEGRTVEVTFSD